MIGKLSKTDPLFARGYMDGYYCKDRKPPLLHGRRIRYLNGRYAGATDLAEDMRVLGAALNKFIQKITGEGP